MDNLVNKFANADIEPSVHSEDTSSDEDSNDEKTQLESGTTTETSAEVSVRDSESTVDDKGKISDNSEAEESEDDSEVTSKKRKWMDEVQYYQQTTENLIPRQPFKRLVREIVREFKPDGRITEEAINILQTVTEDGMGELFRISQMLAIHRGSVTVQPKDIQMARHTCQTLKWDL
jgi:histone H3/H4